MARHIADGSFYGFVLLVLNCLYKDSSGLVELSNLLLLLLAPQVWKVCVQTFQSEGCMYENQDEASLDIRVTDTDAASVLNSSQSLKC